MSEQLSTSTVATEHSHSIFVTWDGNPIQSETEKFSLFQSLVQTIRDGHPFDETLEKKAVNLLDQIQLSESNADRIIHTIAQQPAAPNQFIHPFLPPPPTANGFMDDFISPPSSTDPFEDDFLSSPDPFEDGYPSPPTSPDPFIPDIIPPPAAGNDIIPRVPPPAITDQIINDIVQSSLDEDLDEFSDSIVTLVSIHNHEIIKATLFMLNRFIGNCSHPLVLKLIRTDLIPHIFTSLNPLSLSFADNKEIHDSLIRTLFSLLRHSFPNPLIGQRLAQSSEQQAIVDTVLIRVLIPSEGYIHHVCVNRHSMNDPDHSFELMTLLGRLFRISAYNQPAMDFVLKLPVFLSITSAITLCDHDMSVWHFLFETRRTQEEWNKKGRNVRQYARIVLRCMRMEGFEDVIEQMLERDPRGDGGDILAYVGIQLNPFLPMNLPKH
ncbi:hypothetical protein BLNAU_3048 [Blattamonas nauphoetae]|uniref:Uncharacterized protein n=1 Tax=Blattamonas nauphoetae TaxID=2049346 RepID=A0ABQ9YDZ2_9EUKA|nr:hypothetical protein BLNAU_3048 [Blattamonas nauphoetae]